MHVFIVKYRRLNTWVTHVPMGTIGLISKDSSVLKKNTASITLLLLLLLLLLFD